MKRAGGAKGKWWIGLGLMLGGVLLGLGALSLLPKSESDSDVKPVLSGNYSGLTELVAEQEREGFVPIGRFGDTWPAAIVEVIEGEGNVRFTLRDGTPHEYRKFDGYRLKVLRLVGERGGELVLVLRSREKFSDPGQVLPERPADADAWERERRAVLEERAAEEGRK